MSDSIGQATSATSKEAHKGMSSLLLKSSYLLVLTYYPDVAKDDSQDLGTRASSAKDAVSDKMSETKDSVSYSPIYNHTIH